MDSSESPFDSSNFSGPGESSANESTSATGMFAKVAPQAAHSPEQEDLLQSLLRAESTPASSNPPETPVQPPPQAPPAAARSTGSPGSFTQMFQSLKGAEAPPVTIESAPPAPLAAPMPAASPKPHADLTTVFTPVSINKPMAPAGSTPSAAEPKPGEFTQLLRTLNNPVLKAESSPPPSKAVEAVQPPAQPKSFTQMFQATFAEPVTPESQSTPLHVPEAAPEVTSVYPVPASAPASSQGSRSNGLTQFFQAPSLTGPASETVTAPLPVPATQVAPPEPAAAGGFTQMFQSLSPAKEPAATTAAPGSFTQMFAQIGGQNAPQEDPLASLKPQAPPPGNFQFSTPAATSSANPFGSAPNPAPAASAQGGGFTQLFQALGKEETSPAKERPPLMPSPPPAATPALPPAGGFTQLLRTLNEPAVPSTQSGPAPMPAPVPSQPMPSSAPGEFTRVISSSMLREAQGQGVAPASPPVLPPAGQAGGGQPGFQMSQPPAFAKPAAPPMPQMPQMHAGGTGGAPQMPQFQTPAFQFPPAPPAAAPPPPAQSKLQQYLPLILIVNAFVLIVVILIVVFALRHH
jgi:hypothetical protein